MKIFLSALEVSADVHASKLIRALKGKNKDIYFYGLGGERSKEEGMEILEDVTKYSTVGFVEPIPYIPKLLYIQSVVKKVIKDTKPDAVILIDAQGFNVPLAKFAKDLDIPAFYYFAPQYWLWGNKEKAKEILEILTWVIATFPQEYELYKNFGDNVVYFGHPLIDYLSPYKNNKKEENLIGIFPGSRIQEIKSLTPIFIKIAEKLWNDGFNFVLPLASDKFSDLLYRYVRNKNFIEIVSGKDSQKYLSMSSLGLVASGTVTLEAAILGTPVFVFYKISSITYYIAKKLVHYPYVALPNIVLNKMVFPEYIQKIDIDKVVEDIRLFFRDESYRISLSDELTKLSEKLGTEGVLENIANFILSQI